MTNRGKKRALALCLSLALLVGLLPTAALAAEGPPCENHLEHDAACGYMAPVEGQPCKHEQGEHDDACGWTAGTPETPCDQGCAELDEAGAVLHAEGCAFAPAVAGTPCDHTEHDGACGFVEAAEGFPCIHTCEMCAVQDSGAGETGPGASGPGLTQANGPEPRDGIGGKTWEIKSLDDWNSFIQSDISQVHSGDTVRLEFEVGDSYGTNYGTYILNVDWSGVTVVLELSRGSLSIFSDIGDLTVNNSTTGVFLKADVGTLRIESGSVTLSATTGTTPTIGDVTMTGGELTASSRDTFIITGTFDFRGGTILSNNYLNLGDSGKFVNNSGGDVAVRINGGEAITVAPGGWVNSTSSTFGDFIVTGDPAGYAYDGTAHTLTVKNGADLTISGTTNEDKIKVESGAAAAITLDGVNIDVSGTDYVCAFDMTGATVALTLADGSDNVLKSGYTRAGLEAPDGSTLTIDGGGSLTATGNSSGAGIGGSGDGSGGTITISGGTVTATATGGGAGIGGGDGGSGGTIAISGGTVTAKGGEGGASVGPGKGSSDFDTYIRTVALGGGSQGVEGVAANSLLLGGDGNFTVKGAVTLPCDLTVPGGSVFTVQASAELTVPDGRVLTNNGTLTNDGEIKGGGILTGDGVFGGSGTYTLKVTRAIAQPTADKVEQTSVTLNAVTPPKGGGTVEYAVNTTDTTSAASWQSGLTFDSLTANTTYWFFARVTDGTIYKDAVSNGTAIQTVSGGNTGGGGGGGNTPSPTEQAVSKVEKAKDGDTVKLDLPSNGKLPGKVLEAAAGKDVTLEIDAGGGVTWIINGMDLPKGKLSDLNLKVDAKANTIPVTVINALTGEQKVMQLALSHNGPFGFSLTLRLETGKENAGLFANLYYYNETANALEYQSTAKIGAVGTADIPFTHASSYAVVIDKQSHAPVNPDTGGDNPFTDVKPGNWFHDAVMYIYHNGIMQGTSATTFSPNDGTTRAQLAVILWRMEGSPAPTGGNPFSDVQPDTWYSQAVAWCSQAGLVGGYGGGLFGPGDPISREQLASILYRYAVYKGWDVSMGEDTNILSYADAADVAEWAIPAIQWACGAGIMGGTTDNRLAPQEGATRAQIAAMLMRLLEKYAPGSALPATGGTVTPNPSTGVLNAPRTGDGSGAGWLMLALPVSAAGAAALSCKLRRKRREDGDELPDPTHA